MRLCIQPCFLFIDFTNKIKYYERKIKWVYSNFSSWILGGKVKEKVRKMKNKIEDVRTSLLILYWLGSEVGN